MVKCRNLIAGSQTEIQRQLGNAVPSLLGKVLAVEIRRQLLDAPRRKKRLKLAVSRLSKTEARRPLLAVSSP